MNYLETPFTYTPRVYGTPFQRNKMAILFSGATAIPVVLSVLTLNLAAQEKSQGLLNLAFVSLLAAVISVIMLVSFFEAYNQNKKQLFLDNSHSWGVDSRDRWVYKKLVPYIEKEYDLFLSACKDFRTLEFVARNADNETITIKVKGVREKGFSVGIAALNGYEIVGEVGIEIQNSAKVPENVSANISTNMKIV